MKKKLFYLLILTILTSVVLTSCSRFNLFTEETTPYHYDILKNVNININDNPEHALSLLEDFYQKYDLELLSKAEYFEYNILLSEARYKCNMEHINESTLREAILYFDSLNTLYPNNTDVLFLNAKAHYYLGVGKEENERYKDAFVNYLESIRLLNKINFFKTSDNFINHFKALTLVRLSDILYWLDAYVPSIECLNDANKLFEKENNYHAMARNNVIMSIMYAQNYDYSIALRHLSIADSLATVCYDDPLIRNEIVRMNASIMYNMGYHKEPFDIMLKQFNTLESETQKMEVAGVLGDIYYDLGILDSALYYYEYYLPDNRFSKIDAANHIIEIALKTGNNELVTKYAPILNEETNNELMLSTIKTEITSMYEQYKIESHNIHIYSRVLMCLGIILSFTILFFIFGMYLINLKKIKYNKELDEKKFYINSLQEKIDKKSSENKHIKQKIKSLEVELQEIKTKKYLTHAPFDMKLKKLMEHPKCVRLSEICLNNNIKTNTEYPDLLISEAEQKELIDLFNKTFDNAFNRIISENEGLKYHDSLYFCFYLIGMSEKHISAVTGKSYNIIYNRTKKIQSILGKDKSIREALRDIIGQLPNS